MGNKAQTLLTTRLLEHEKNNPERVYLKQPKAHEWHSYTWKDVMQQARKVANFLQQIGLARGAHVSIFSKNCAEWFIADFGITLAGMVSVPLFSNQHQSNVEYILEHAEVQLVFIGKLDKHHQVSQYIPNSLKTINFNYHKDIQTTYGWEEILASEPLEDIVHPTPDDLFTIIYSSGTSGKPKGAMYTHGALGNYLDIFAQDLKRYADLPFYRLISYLPLAHVYERSAIQIGSVCIPCDVSFVESLETFGKNLETVQPNVFAAVPRIWGVFQQKIEQKLPARVLSFLLHIPILSRVIKNKIKYQLGLKDSVGNISGAAHLPVDIIRFFEHLDIIIQEGYGQTENFAYATLSTKADRKPGYVGAPRIGVDIKLGHEQELVMTGPCLMKGYYKDAEATAQAFTSEGWLRTGDIVEIDAQQRVKILGRLSENFKNQKGEFITPTPIEKLFSSNHAIEYLCLVGRGLASNVLLITLTKDAKQQAESDIEQSLRESLKTINHELKSYEKVSHILIAKDEWSIENNILTPTLKVKRRIVEERYEEFIQASIKQSKPILWEK